MFDAEQRVSIDSSLLEYLDRSPSQRKSQCPCESLATHRDRHLLVNSCRAADRNRFSNRGPNHLFATARPALIKARIRDKNRQVVPSSVASRKRTRWASGNIVAAYNSGLRYIIED